MIYKNSLELIGSTPILQLNKLGYENVYVKLEKYNPAGSIKDRVVNYMIEGLEQNGVLKKGDKIVEATSGNTGIALAMIGCLKGYEVIIIMPETMSKERRDLVKAYGAKLILTDGKKGMNGAVEKAEEILKYNKEYKSLGQFNNEDNPRSHFETTGVEIMNDINDIDIFVCSVGTGGTLSGIGRYLKSKNSNIKIVALEPSKFPHNIQGIGANFVPKNYDKSIVDEVILINDEDAFNTVRLMANKEGILVGISSGANIFGAVELAKRYKNKKIVTVAPDGIDKYISMGIFN